jgi:hypothetical protein
VICVIVSNLQQYQVAIRDYLHMTCPAIEGYIYPELLTAPFNNHTNICKLNTPVIPYVYKAFRIVHPTVSCVLSVGKGNAVPLQAWTGPQDSRRSRLPDF